ncbi:MAG: ABC transporter permease [Candidatus Portnoybacteria bacterium]|nr:ABC transporter permease [Candidatus Portnoybacteria bacterium]
MNLTSIIKQSITALKANKLRSAISILGIVIGVGAVVLILSLGQGLKGLVTNEVEAFGPNMLDIAIKIPGTGQMGTLTSMVQGIKITTLNLDDVKDLKDKSRFPYIEAVSGQAIGQEWVTYRNKEKKSLLYGCGADFLVIYKMAEMSKGRFFNENEDNSLAKVAVLGSGLAEELFGQADPLGKKIKLKGQNIKVIGVLEPQGMFSSFGGIDMNDFVYLPLQTALKEVLGIDYLSEIVLMINSEEYIPQAEEEISRMLRRNHNITDPDKDDFMITTMGEILEQINEISVILNLLLGFLAAISLLVGGIGIMNIMLVSVSERTREIGLRKSLGATEKDVLKQFLIESLVITGLGGFIGIFLGIGSSLIGGLAARTQGLAWPLTISWLAIVIAFFVSMTIGLIFGLYPARKAAQLSPIEAMRRE